MYKIDVDYKLPIAWEIVTLSDVCDIDPSVDFKALGDETEISFVPMALVEELTGKLKSDNFERVGKLKKGYSRFKNGDVLFAKITPCMENGKIAVAENLPFEVGAGSTEFFVLRSSFGICNKFVLYYLLQKAYRLDAQHHMSGAVGQKRVPKTYISNSRIPLPPLAEQKRIVDKIETLFSDLDKGEALLKQVQQQLAVYRQSVLKAAVTGELTREWREKNKHRLESGEELLKQLAVSNNMRWRQEIHQESSLEEITGLPVLPDTWTWATLSQLGDMGRGKSKHRPRNDPKLYENGKYPFLQTGTVRNSSGKINSYDDLYNEVGLKQSKLWSVGTVCITIAANIAESGLLEIEACFPDSIVGIVPYDGVNGEYVEFFIRTAKNDLDRFAPATAQKNINLQILEKVAIPLPSTVEQNEIVDRINDIFSQIDALEKWCATELARSGMLRQSILRAAFSGELVPQDPEDEPASELLARIQAERASAARDKFKPATVR